MLFNLFVQYLTSFLFLFEFYLEIILCKPNPCRHGGRCIVIDSQKFSCDCQNTGYEGDLCERGVVTPPDFPKLIPGRLSEDLSLLAKPNNVLTVLFDATLKMTFHPKRVMIQYPSDQAEFKVIGHESGVGMVSYDLSGIDKHTFVSPTNSPIFVGHNISNVNSIYTRLGLLNGEVPIGCRTKNLQNFPCGLKVAYSPSSTLPNDVLVQSGPVHIITSDNKTIPLSLVGYNFSSPYQSGQESELLKTLIAQTSSTNTSSAGQTSNEMCSFQPTTEALIEFIQEDAFPKSFMRYLTDKLPLWIRLMVKDDNNLFAAENTRADLIQITSTQSDYLNCKFPPLGIPNAMVTYRPKVTFTISAGRKQISLPSKGCCFATDPCGSAVFLTLSEKAGKEISKMPVLKDLTYNGWGVLLSSFGFTAPKKYQSLTNSLPSDPMAEHFSDFHYNMWWKGTTNISLKNTSDFTINMKMSGQVFSFVEDLNSVSIKPCLVTIIK